MKRFFNRNVVIDILFIFFLSLTPLLWFKGSAVMLGHDNVFPLDPTIFLLGRLSTWIEQGFGQSQMLIMGTIPIHFIDAIPAFLGFSIQNTQKIVYVFWFFLMGISAYILAHTLNKESRVFKITATVFYIFNFFILQGWWVGERTKFSAYVALPLIIALYFKVKQKEINVFRAAVLNSIIFLIFNGGGLYGISLFGGFFICIGVFILFSLLFSYFDNDYKAFKRIIVLTILTFTGYGVVNSYYILPALFHISTQYGLGLEKGGGISGFIDWASEISAFASFINVFRLEGIAEWYDNPHHPYSKYYLSNPLLIAISFLWPILIGIVVLLYKRRDKLQIILFFFLCYLIGIFFVAGTHPPTGFLYEQFMRIIPGSAAFRSPYFKFAPTIFLASSFLIAYFVDFFKCSLKKFIFVLLIIVGLLYHFPFFTGDFFSWRKDFSTRLDVPSYVFDFGKWLNEEKQDDGRVLLLPPNSTESQQSMYKWGYLSFQSIPSLLSNKSVIVNNDRINDEERELITQLYKAIAAGDKHLLRKFSSILQVKYLVLQHDSYSDSNSAISTDEQIYRKVLHDTFQFPLEKQIGQWDIFKINTINLKGPIFVSEKIDSLDGSVKDIVNHYDFSDNTNFLIAGDSNILNSIEIPNELSGNFYVPKCINCPNKNKPVVRFPRLNILPDSPFYPLVVLRENLQIKTMDPKTAVYNGIGISLKRVSELKDTLQYNKSQSDAVFARYDAVLKDIIVNFNRIEKYEDKIQVADDINYYMEAQKNYILPILGTNITNGLPISIFGRTFQRIASVIANIDRYLFKLDITNNRLYQVSIKKEEDFELLVKKDKLMPVLKENEKIIVDIDGTTTKEIKINPAIIGNEWFSFGTLHLSSGMHQLLLSFPQLPNNLGELKESKTEFNINLENTCFIGKLISVVSQKTYRVLINYTNDFSEDLYFYAWEIKEKEKNLIDIVKLKTGLSNEEFSELIKAQPATKGIEIGVCSKVLTGDLVNRKLKFKVNEILYPTFALNTKNKKQEIVKEIHAEKINPTKYRVSFATYSDAAVVIFSERFDKGWKLSGFDNTHLRINGYANGWLINKKGSYSVSLEYKPQKVFMLGTLFSAITIIGLIWFTRKGGKN